MLDEDNVENDTSIQSNDFQNNEDQTLSAKENLENQTKRMEIISDASHPPAEEGMSARIKVPEVDRGRGDSRSIIGCIMKKTDDGVFKRVQEMKF
ncbi:hypothetical protein Zmor_021678 [Zophobas morio]|uniref:Uncharacterized protein n=1 Tax=Zophobas morio TaxID=2755281 RepID=A0AA38I5Y6_9CUCU|nr:hypothetical protein Zmor_021678 [Zophobas morio]